MTYIAQFFREGSYNYIYKIVDEHNTVIGVFKLQKPPEKNLITEAEQEQDDVNLSMDTVERSVRIWNEINPDLAARPFEVTIHGVKKSGWLCPYIEGRQANDKEITQTLIDIYERTGRVVVDATGNKNVLTQTNGRSVCIDVGFAIRLDYEYGPLPRIRNGTQHHHRRGSFTSVSQWRPLQNDFPSFWSQLNATYPHANATIQALLLLSQYKPELRKVDFLQQRETAQLLAKAYQYPCEDLITKVLAYVDLLLDNSSSPVLPAKLM